MPNISKKFDRGKPLLERQVQVGGLIRRLSTNNWLYLKNGTRYEGHSKSYLPDHLTIMFGLLLYITAAEYQLAQYLVTGHLTLFFT